MTESISLSKPETETESNDEGGQVSRDDLFEVLSNRRRRHVLHYLDAQPEGRAELSDVVEQVAAWENGTEKGQLSYDDRKSVHISLYQHHAPKMDEAGVIDYDKRAGVLELTDAAAAFGPYLEPSGESEESEESDRPWAVYFSLLSVAMGGVVLAGGLDVLPFWLPDIAWAGAVVLAFALSSLGFLYDTHSHSHSHEDGDEDGPPPEVASDDAGV